MCPPLNIINVYVQQECRDMKKVKERFLASWIKIKKEFCLIAIRGESVILFGDLNRAVGYDRLGVCGNKKKVSFGGQLVRDLLDTKEYVIFNNLERTLGGPWTRKWPQLPRPGHWVCEPPGLPEDCGGG